MRIVLPGGTGYLGTWLARSLTARGDHVAVLTRGESNTRDGVEFVHWDGRSRGEWCNALEGSDAIVHLSGKRVDCRPTQRNINELIRSRVDPVLAVGSALVSISRPPGVWIQLSSLAIFGEGGEALIDETSLPPNDGPRQMTEVCRRWEAAFEASSRRVTRTVLLRPSIAIGGPGDPATERLLALVRMGLGGRVGSGQQWVSWIDVEDLIAIVLQAVDDDSMEGLYHATSPEPVRNSEMMATYRRLLGRKRGLSSPSWVTRPGAWLMGSDPALALTGRKGVPGRLLRDGFVFSHPSFGDAAARAVDVALAR